jgi:hypothetical protein
MELILETIYNLVEEASNKERRVIRGKSARPKKPKVDRSLKRVKTLNKRHAREKNQLMKSISFNRNMQTQRWAHNKRLKRMGGGTGRKRRMR